MPVAHPERLLHQCLALMPREALARSADAELLRRFGQCGDEDAFAALIARHGPMVLAVCRRLLRDGAAEDVAQATFLVLARKAGSVRRPEALAGWLHRTACHLAQKHRRAEARRRDREARVSQVSPRFSADPVAELADKELREAIDEEIGRMPERFRLPVVLCCLEGRTLEETGKRLDWTPGSVKGRLERGRAELRDRLVRRGFTLSAVGVVLDALREGARAGLPAGFGAATLRAAVVFGSGASAGLGNAVASIAEEGVRGATLFTRKVVLSFVLALGVLGGGIAAVAPPARPVEAKPRADAKPAPAEKPRADRQGDPLPDGAIARLGTVRWRSPQEIEAMAFAPDGKTLAAASRDGIRIFDAKGKLVREIRSDFRRINSLAFSPDGKRLACRCLTDDDERTAWGRRTVRIYDLEGTRKPLEYSEQAIKWAGWSASGEPLAVRLEKDAVVLRELISGKEPRIDAKNLPERDTDGFACVYSPVAKVLAFPDSLGAIHIWNVNTRKKLGTLETKGAYAPILALSPDGRSLAALRANRANEWTMQLWDVATSKVRHTVTTDQKYNLCVAFAPDGKTLAVGNGNGVRFWDAFTGRERIRTKSRYAFGNLIAFSPDGKTLVTSGFHSGTLHLWDVATAEPKPVPQAHTNRTSSADFSPDGKRIVTSGSMDGTIIVWNPTTGEPLTVIHRGGWVRGAAFSADGKSLFSASTDDRLVVHDASSGRLLHESSLEDPARKDLSQSAVRMRLSSDRKSLVTFSSGYAKGQAGADSSPLITGWDAVTRKPTYRRTLVTRPVWEKISPDLRLLAMSQGGKFDPKNPPGGRPVRIEDLETGKHHLDLPQLPRQTAPMEFSPDGRLLTTWTSGPTLPGGKGERAYTLRVWEVATAGEVLSLPFDEAAMIAGVTFSGDSRLMAVGVPTREIAVWDLRRGEELQRFKGFDADLLRLCFSPDARRLVSGHTDSTLLVWEVRKPKPVHARPLDAERLSQAWADLAEDPKKAFAARGSLAGSPAEAVAFLKKRLEPIRPADADRVRRLIADLDDDSFAAREKARKGLEALGELATEALTAALEAKPSAEARKHIRALLGVGAVPDRETLRSVRAVAVLEDIGTREAKAVLETMAGGLAGARLTRETKAALRRMGSATASGER